MQVYPIRGRKEKRYLVVTIIKDDLVSLDILDKLLQNIRYNERGCWIRGDDSTIYTAININGKSLIAHRVSYELFRGKKLLKQGCHHCDTPACINPDHIFDGSQSQNMWDAQKKNRLIRPSLKIKPPLTFFGHKRFL